MIDMGDPRAEATTRIERVTEAFEALTIAVVANVQLVNEGQPREKPPALFKNVLDARAELATSLRELLKPTLRVVSGQ
jgi:hypothetical protein